MFKIREPFAAGTLYESSPAALKGQIERCFGHKLGPNGMEDKDVICGIAPHNSFEASGPIAAWLYAKLKRTNSVILGASHKPISYQFSIAKEGLWKTPLGELLVDTKMANKICDSSNLIEYDFFPHQTEHSIEAQLPFLQYRFGNDFRFVPMLIYNQFADESFLNNCIAVGDAIANSIKGSKDNWTVIASSDFSQDKKFDAALIKALLNFDSKKFFEKIKGKEERLCGFGPLAVAVAVAEKMGAENGKLLKYASASQINQGSKSDAGYASIIFY